ncbi:unnamed protein product [Tilletia laevis]|uniref:Uncharacterized protein n=3 Tax=Tilletia TaxID=13289 RepID=A0A8X7SYV0_9BASI|nr:hypothetical protein CF336_g2028 [Tilletia laevis]KAE8252220.1 hypothetical protein A4X06_0g2350 [Tilletia controversa]KAE8263608.1 hypothetical protein A4X03_0g1557 [Tilletia caries]CAD6893629.1 unnamed protein product [Tilletia caries]CAD6920871.1 unnamed protein product [Tilletia laevis]
MSRRTHFAQPAPMATRSRMQSLRPESGPAYRGMAGAPRQPSVGMRAPSGESSTSIIATLNDNNARKRRRVFSGARKVEEPPIASASGIGAGPSGSRFPDDVKHQPQRLRPSLEHGADGALNVQDVIDRCSILAIQSKSVLDFYGKFQYDGWSDETIPRMNATWNPFNSYKVHQLLLNKDYGHHFVNVAEVIGQLEVEPNEVPPQFEETMRLVNFATFIHYVFQVPTNADAFHELEDGRVTFDIALTAPIRTLTELNDARRVFLKWIVPTSWTISDEILCIFLDLSTHIHIQRVRLYAYNVNEGSMSPEEFEIRLQNSIDEMTSSEVLLNSLSQTANERGLSGPQLDRLIIRYEQFAQVRSEDLAQLGEQWISMLQQWPLQRLTDDLLQLVEKAVKVPEAPLQSFSLPSMRNALGADFFLDQEIAASEPLMERSDLNGAGPSNGDTTVIVREMPAESTPRPRDQLKYPRRYNPDQAPATQEYSEEIQALFHDDDDMDDLLDPEGEAPVDEASLRRFAIREVLMDSQELESEQNQSGEAEAVELVLGKPQLSTGPRKSIGTVFNLDLAGDDDGKPPSALLPKQGKGKARAMSSSEDERDDDVSLQEQDAGDAYERSQARAAQTVARGRVSIGAEAARDEATARGRPMSSHTRDALGSRNKLPLVFGKDNILMTATGAKKSILNDKSKGERITFDNDADEDVFLEHQQTRKRGQKKAEASPAPSNRTTRSAARFTPDVDAIPDVDVIPDMDVIPDVDVIPVQNGDGRGNDKGKQRAIEDDPLQVVQEEEQPPMLLDFGGGDELDVGMDFGDDDGGVDFDALVRAQNADDKEDQDPEARDPEDKDQQDPDVHNPEDNEEQDPEAHNPEDKEDQHLDTPHRKKGSVVEDSEDGDESDSTPRKSELPKGGAGRRKFPSARPNGGKGADEEQASPRSERHAEASGSRSLVLAKAGQKRLREGDEPVLPRAEDGDEDMSDGDTEKKTSSDEEEERKEDDDELQSEADQVVVKVEKPKKRRRKSANVDTHYHYGVTERRFWTPKETKCLMDALHKYAYLLVIGKKRSTGKSLIQIYDHVMQRHGPHGYKSTALARRNHMQLKDKARSELQRMRREDLAMPYWKPLLFPSLFANMKNRGKVRKMPSDIEVSDDEAEKEPKGGKKKKQKKKKMEETESETDMETEEEEEVEDEDEEVEDDEEEEEQEQARPSPAPRSPPKKNMAKGGPASLRKSASLSPPKKNMAKGGPASIRKSASLSPPKKNTAKGGPASVRKNGESAQGKGKARAVESDDDDDVTASGSPRRKKQVATQEASDTEPDEPGGSKKGSPRRKAQDASDDESDAQAGSKKISPRRKTQRKAQQDTSDVDSDAQEGSTKSSPRRKTNRGEASETDEAEDEAPLSVLRPRRTIVQPTKADEQPRPRPRSKPTKIKQRGRSGRFEKPDDDDDDDEDGGTDDADGGDDGSDKGESAYEEEGEGGDARQGTGTGRRPMKTRSRAKRF